MKHRKFGGSQEASAAKAWFSEWFARNLEARSFEVSKHQKRWKTRVDPFEDAWGSILLTLLSSPHRNAQMGEFFPLPDQDVFAAANSSSKHS